MAETPYRIPLRSDFRFVHEPTSRENWFIGREEDIEELTRRLQYSDGGSFLITGYRAARALTLAAAAAQLRRLISAPLPEAEQSKFDRWLAPAWKTLSAPEGRNAWAKGIAMSPEKAMQYSLQELDAVSPGWQGQ